MSRRTPTPGTDQIWSQEATTARWHQLWLAHLKAQTNHNPNHPAKQPGNTAIEDYQQAHQRYLNRPGTWLADTDTIEQTTRHDLQAALRKSNLEAGHDLIHHGLTSHDITDVATQQAIVENTHLILEHVEHIIGVLTRQANEHRDWRILARTHGQPAQTSSYGLRIATILGPLIDWYQRTNNTLSQYPLRPPWGAVGTAADLARVLTGWAPDQPASPPPRLRDPAAIVRRYPDAVRFDRSDQRITPLHYCAEKRGATAGDGGDTERCGCWWDHTSPAPPPLGQLLEDYEQEILAGCSLRANMTATRQIYHRSYDLPIASAMVELASIAQTWATDRRLEAMLGLGNERRDPGQVGSSAMAHKTNPVLAERICSLASLTRGHYTTLAELAGQGWFEGDVSTSGARRELWPALFSNLEAIISNWAEAAERWLPDRSAMSAEVDRYLAEAASGAVLQWLVERGATRQKAHEAIASWVAAPFNPEECVDDLLKEVEGVLEYGSDDIDELQRAMFDATCISDSTMVVLGRILEAAGPINDDM